MHHSRFLSFCPVKILKDVSFPYSFWVMLINFIKVYFYDITGVLLMEVNTKLKKNLKSDYSIL